MQLVTISRIKLVQLISWAWFIVKENDNKNNNTKKHDIYNKKYNQTYSIIEHSRHLVINLAKM